MLRFILVVHIVLINFCSVICQNIYDADNSFKYGKFLYQSNDYLSAINEFERVVFLYPENTDAQYLLLKSFRLTNNFEQGINHVETFYNNDFISIPGTISEEYLKLLFLNNDFSKASEFYNFHGNNLDTVFKANLICFSYIFQQQWDTVYSFSVKNKTLLLPDLYDLSASLNNIKYKNPYLSMSMSAIIPGLGKVYSGAWKDGIFSLLFIATNSWQAYRGFSKKGISSAYGWIFSSVAFTFYAGNLYGSFQSAKKYNKNIDEDILQKTLDIFNSDF